MSKAAVSMLAVLCLSAGCRRSESTAGAATPPPPPVVKVATVQRTTVPIYRQYVGRTDANRTVNIQPQVSGILLAALFNEGQPVSRGAVLFRIDPSQFDAELRSAEAQLGKARADVEQAKAQLGKARQDVERFEPLARERAIPQQDSDNALAAAKVAEAQVAQAISDVHAAQAAAAQARLNLGYTEIRSPIAGIIGRRAVDPGNLVTPQTLLVTVSNTNPVRVHYDLSEIDYLRFVERTGGTSPTGGPLVKLSYELVLADGTTYPYKGQFYLVDRAVTPQTGTLPIIAEFPNPNNLLRPGQFVRVRVTAGEIPNGMLIPQTAVQELLGTTSVLVVGPDNKVTQRAVTTTGTFESSIIVTEGLQPGERIIVEGQQKVRPGMTVQPEPAAPPQNRTAA